MPIKKNQDETRLGYYYLDMKKTVKWVNSPMRKLDESGVLLYRVPYTDSYHNYPVNIAQYALGNFEMFLDTKDNKYEEAFLKQADWLVNNISDKKEFGIWEHGFVLPYYNFNKVPWVHGMAQGLAISALLRAFQITGNSIYFETAKRAYGAFEKNIEEGGIKFIDENGNVWLEEYTVLPPPHILNGFIYALFGIYDFYHVIKNEKALNLWNEGVGTLEKNIGRYDNGYWSLYNLLHKYPATKSYHILHIKQLKILYDLTSKEIFNEYARRWNNYLNSRMNVGRAELKRGIIHLKRYGVRGCIKAYFLRRKWQRVD